jgi:hypothetical protein
MYIRKGFVLVYLSLALLLSVGAGVLGIQAGQASLPPTITMSTGYTQVHDAFLACIKTIDMAAR